jgi:hypothetical protein
MNNGFNSSLLPAMFGSSDLVLQVPVLFTVAHVYQETEPINYNPLPRGKFMANLKGLASIVSELRVERTNLASQLKRVDAALSVLGESTGKSNGRRSYTKPRRALSASARKRISLAQKARWAKRAGKGQAAKTKPKRILSASARRKIAAAQRARWAKVKAQQKKAA